LSRKNASIEIKVNETSKTYNEAIALTELKPFIEAISVSRPNAKAIEATVQSVKLIPLYLRLAQNTWRRKHWLRLHAGRRGV